MDNIIPHIRRERRIKQTDMARALDVSPSYLCKVEKGLLQPSENFKKVCSKYLNMPVSEIFPEKVKKKKASTIPVETDNMLWHVRKQKGIKQYELAERLSCSPSFLSKVEKGIQEPNSQFRKKCAKILKVKENILFP